MLQPQHKLPLSYPSCLLSCHMLLMLLHQITAGLSGTRSLQMKLDVRITCNRP